MSATWAETRRAGRCASKTFVDPAPVRGEHVCESATGAWSWIEQRLAAHLPALLGLGPRADMRALRADWKELRSKHDV